MDRKLPLNVTLILTPFQLKKASAPYILSGQNPIVRRTYVFSQVSRYSEIELFMVIRCYVSTETIELIRLAPLLALLDRQ